MVGFVGSLALALLVALAPGASFLLALGLRRPVLYAALAAPCSVAVAAWTGNAAALIGLPFGRSTLGVMTLVLLASGVLVAVRRGSLRAWRTPPRRPGFWATRTITAVALGIAVLGVLRAIRVWWIGLGGSIDTAPQEHDTVLHVVLAAFIERTGRGAVWQLAPVDLLDGAPTFFYPAGFHLLAATTAQMLGGDVVAGVNAVTIIFVVVVTAMGTSALAVVAARRVGLGRTGAVLAAAVATVVALSLYRPAYQLAHDGGILANIAAFALVPGVVAGVLSLSRARSAAVIAVAAAAAGAVTVHPSAIASIGVTVVAMWLGDLLLARERRRLAGRILAATAAGGVALLFCAPTLVLGLAVSGRTAGFPVDTSSTPLPRALGTTLSFPYGGFLDPDQVISQVAPAGLAVAAAVVLLVARRGWGPLLAWVTWSVIALAQLVAPKSPVTLVTGFFYNAYLRVASHIAIVTPVLIGVAAVVATQAVAVVLRRRSRFPARPVAAALTLGLAVVYLALPSRHYAAVGTEAVATRYAHSDFYRVDGDDSRAIDFLSGVVGPGQRVMNSANDGSTYLYIYRGIPVVNIGTLGLDNMPYTSELLADFNRIGRDPEVDELVRDLDIRWVYVDARAPTIGSGYSPGHWVPSSSYSTAPGLADLDAVPALRRVFTSGSVAVYAVTPPA